MRLQWSFLKVHWNNDTKVWAQRLNGGWHWFGTGGWEGVEECYQLVKTGEFECKRERWKNERPWFLRWIRKKRRQKEPRAMKLKIGDGGASEKGEFMFTNRKSKAVAFLPRGEPSLHTCRSDSDIYIIVSCSELQIFLSRSNVVCPKKCQWILLLKFAERGRFWVLFLCETRHRRHPGPWHCWRWWHWWGDPLDVYSVSSHHFFSYPIQPVRTG